MNVKLLPGAEEDLERACAYYESQSVGLSDMFLDDFRRGVDRIIEFPEAWQKVGTRHRRYRLARFPYAIAYRLDHVADEIVLEAIIHLHQSLGWWKATEN